MRSARLCYYYGWKSCKCSVSDIIERTPFQIRPNLYSREWICSNLTVFWSHESELNRKFATNSLWRNSRCVYPDKSKHQLPSGIVDNDAGKVVLQNLFRSTMGRYFMVKPQSPGHTTVLCCYRSKHVQTWSGNHHQLSLHTRTLWGNWKTNKLTPFCDI